MQGKSNAPEMCHDTAAGIPYKSFFRVDFISDGGKVMLIKRCVLAVNKNETLCFTALLLTQEQILLQGKNGFYFSL